MKEIFDIAQMVVTAVILLLLAVNIILLLIGVIRTKMYKPDIPPAKDDV